MKFKDFEIRPTCFLDGQIVSEKAETIHRREKNTQKPN